METNWKSLYIYHSNSIMEENITCLHHLKNISRRSDTVIQNGANMNIQWYDMFGTAKNLSATPNINLRKTCLFLNKKILLNYSSNPKNFHYLCADYCIM